MVAIISIMNIFFAHGDEADEAIEQVTTQSNGDLQNILVGIVVAVLITLLVLYVLDRTSKKS